MTIDVKLPLELSNEFINILIDKVSTRVFCFNKENLSEFTNRGVLFIKFREEVNPFYKFHILNKEKVLIGLKLFLQNENKLNLLKTTSDCLFLDEQNLTVDDAVNIIQYAIFECKIY